MRNQSFAVLAILLFPAVAPAQVAREQQQVRDEIRAEVGKLITATNFDVMASLPMYVSSSRVTSINDAQIVRGWSALRRQTETQARSQGSFFVRLGEVNVTALGPDHALAYASMTMEYPSSTGRVNIPGSMTLAYERTPDGWKVVHEHYSTGLTEAALTSMAQQARSQGDGLVGFLRILFAGLSGGLDGIGVALLDELAGDTCPRD